MATRKTPIDLSEYLPDQATADAAAERDVAYNRNVDPKLLARLAELNRMDSSPEILRVAPKSVAAYVPPTDVPGPPEHDKTVPRAAPKVALALPPRPGEMPTQPSLKRLRGEPDLPGVVKAPPDGRRPSMRTNALALAAVIVPVVIVILVMGRIMRHQQQRTDGAASAVATSAPTAKPNALPSATPNATATATSNALPAPSVVPSTPARPAAPPPKSTAPKAKPRGTLEDRYDAAPPATSVPSATPTVVPARRTPPASSAEPLPKFFH